MSISFLGSLILNKIIEKEYISRKSEFENVLETFLDKKVDLGNYSGIRFLGISLSKSKIIDKLDQNSKIQVKNTFIGIMPIRSLLNQKWIFDIRPKETEINLNKDFFKRENSKVYPKKIKKNKMKFDLDINLKQLANIKVNDFGIDTRFKGRIIYKSNTNQIIGNIKSNFKEKGNLKLKLNSNLNQDKLSLEIFSNGINLKDYNYDLGERNFFVKQGNFKSNFKFQKSSKQTFCKGGISLSELKLNTSNLVETIDGDNVRFKCQGNNLLAKSQNLKYGTLISDFNLDIPLNQNINNINLNATVGYLDSTNPEIKLTGNLPYWFDKRGINLGNINSSFNINRTQLSNLNIFRSKGLRGFITAKGTIKGKIFNPNILINFNVDYPHFKGIRNREIWEGEIKNERKKYLVNMKNRYSPVPSFISFKFDSNIELEELTFSRVFNTNKGSLNITRNSENYIWNANNFTLDEIELSINNNKFDRIGGIINGYGFISTDQSNYKGRLALSEGKYRKIKLDNSIINFTLNENSLNLNSSLYPVDGGMIDIEIDSTKDKIFKANLQNISTDWSLLTALDIFRIDNQKINPKGKSRDLQVMPITNYGKSFKDNILDIEKILNEKSILEDKINLKRYLSKFESRYNANIIISGDRPDNYRLKTNLNGYLGLKNDSKKIEKEDFSIDLEGGFLSGDGLLRINKLPLNSVNIFLNRPRDFKGNLDINLLYNLDSKTFSTKISSNNTSISNSDINIQKGKVEYNKSIFDLDLSLLLNNTDIPIEITGSVPFNREDKLDLRIFGNGKFIELVDILADDYFTFIKGDITTRMIIKGSINKPITNGFIVINNSEVDLYNNIFKNINGTILFDFDSIEIKNFVATGEGNSDILIRGNLPFYEKNSLKKKNISFITNKNKAKTSNIKLVVDSNINIAGSFQYPIIGGKLSLYDGFVNLNNTNKKNIKNNKFKEKNFTKNWPELYWNKEEKIEILSNETILNSFLLGENVPKYLRNISFNNLQLKLGPNFKVQYGEMLQANLDTKTTTYFNGKIGKDLKAWGQMDLSKGKANLYTTPFKLDKNKDNYLLFAPSKGLVPYVEFHLVSKVPDSIMQISQNNLDLENKSSFETKADSNSFGSIGIGNTRKIKIEASYEGFLNQLSFEDENKSIQYRSSPSYSRSEIIGLIGGNSANLINRAFISQLDRGNVFGERFQLSLYPALIENNEPINNVFSNENLDINDGQETSSNYSSSSQAWVAEIGLDITDRINFAVQGTPDRDDLLPTGIFTFQPTSNLELLGSFDSSGDWKSQFQLFWRY